VRKAAVAPNPAPAILAAAWAVPSRVVGNGDPIFDYLRQHQLEGQNLFQGYHERRFLAPGQAVTDLILQAAQAALTKAGLAASAVDRLYGYSSVSLASTPNDLGLLHRTLGMNEHARVIAINTEFTNFPDAVEAAHDAIVTGRCGNALIAMGSNWTRFVDYRTPPSLSAGDGAAAVLLGPRTDKSQFELVDSEALVGSQYFGTMVMQPEPVPNAGNQFTHPYFQILANGAQGFTDFAIPSVPRVTAALLKRHGLTGSDITLATHQASSVMLDQWEKEILPRFYAKTFDNFANTTLAALPISFAFHYDAIPTDWVVLCGVGHYFHTTAILLRRGV
jgi:3-oxoacyl-[acyl-carrier-protein] synthase III